jgi:predicted Fe-Mo cluster-binding NifX family protein
MKGRQKLKVAIPTENKSISPHFGRCPNFTIVDIEGGKVKGKKEIKSPGHSPGLLPDHFSSLGIDTVIAGGMGTRAQELFSQKNIKVILGAEGETENIIDDIINNRLNEGTSSCKPGSGKGYGLEKPECDHLPD